MRSFVTVGWAAVICSVQDWMGVLVPSMLLSVYVLSSALQSRNLKKRLAKPKPKRRPRL